MDAQMYQAWRTGQIVPGRITLARSKRNLTPEGLANVCGTDAEGVDLWEQGIEYPEWEQFQDMVAVTGFRTGFFTRPVSGPGALFLVPDEGDGHAPDMEDLRAGFTPLSVRITTRGWPRSTSSPRVHLSE